MARGFQCLDVYPWDVIPGIKGCHWMSLACEIPTGLSSRRADARRDVEVISCG